MSAPAAEGPRPLSPAQAGVWYAQRLDPADPVFHMGGYLDILGPADPELLKATVAALVAEDETARLRFTEVDGVPFQHFVAEADFVPRLYDVSDEPDPAAAAMRIMRADLGSPPDLEHGPLFEHLLFRLGDEHFVWYNRVHHLVHDGYSASIQRRRAAEIYTALAGGDAPGTPYGSYAALLDEQAGYTGSAAQRRDRAYWTRVMAGAEPPGGPGVSGSSPTGAARRIVRDVSEVDAHLCAALAAFAERSKVTWQQALLTVAVLHRQLWTGGTDVLLGLPVPGRVTPGSHRTPGMAANTVPLRCGVDPGEPCEDLAARVAALSLRAQWHQRYADTDLLRDLDWPVRGRSRFGPVVNIVAGEEQTAFAGIPAVSHLLSTGGTADDLTLSVTHGDHGRLRLDFTIDAAHAEGVDLAAYRRSFHQVLSSVVTGRPGRPVAELEVCDAGERVWVVEGWNDTGAPAEERSVPAVFAAQAARTPDATAVVFGEDRLTYRQLDSRSSRLAHHLIETGCRRGDVIGVLLERGTDFALTLPAVLKTGAAYAVLDPDHPDDRLTTTLADAALTTVVTHTRHQHRLPDHVRRIVLDTLDLNRHPVTPPPDATTPDDAACLMFTSGSTGRPKAILTPHRAITGTLHHQTYTPLGPAHTTLQCSPTGWDAFSLEFWGALLHGATTVLHPGQKPEPDTIHHLTHTHPITTLQTSSTLFNYLVDHHPTTFEHLHTAFTGGEPASPAHVARILKRYPNLRVINGYGPAESMGFTTTHEIHTPDDATTSTLPIGRPITNKQAYVLDTALRPVPIGVTGELYLAGTGLAHGYHNQPTLTATRFVPHPYGPPGTRLYRTGDLAHWTTHGHLHYDGRTDTQIKIRGFRIEPAEIEHTLLKHPHITQAAITPTTNPTGQPCLTAYLTTTHETDLDASEVKRWLRTMLPDHMVPAAVTILDQLPVTPNGKLDHRALPAPRFAVKEAGRPPRTAREAVLCDLFREVLNTARPVTIDDDFFDLGGHSLLAARLTHRTNHTLDTHLTIRDVFQAPTVAHLTTRIDGQEDGVRPARSALVAAERPERAPLSEAQRRLWLQASVDGHGTAYNVPLAVRLDGAVDRTALHAAFRDLVRRHEVLRTVVVQEDGTPEPWQRILGADAPDALAFEVLPSSQERIEDDLRSAAAHVFELTRRPPLRVTLFELAAGERYVLSVVLHHIATDGQSVRPLFEDLTEAYRARLAGEAPGWRPLPVQYADHAHRQRRTLVESGALEDDLAYWTQALAGLPEELGLQPDRPRPAQAGHLGGAVPVSFGPDVMNGVRQLARAERCTPFMVLHAALVATLTRMGAGTDVPIGSPVAGRSSDELRGLVGFFVNTLVLRADASGDPSFRELLARVRHTDLDAFAHQEAPFDRVLEAVNPVRSLSRHPLFQVCLALEDGEDLAVELPGTARTYARVVDTPTAKYDWEFLLRDDPVDGLSGAVLYSAEIYDPATAERMVRAFRTVLQSAVADPDLALSAVDVLDAGERVWVVEGWNDTGAPAEERSVPAVFAAQAARTPDATAVVFGEDRLTYRALDARSSRLAHHLIEAGCRRGDVIGVLLERGTDFALTLPAVLKTGAAYAVLDPDYPDDRLTTTLADAALTTVITHTRHQHRLPDHVRRIVLDTLDLNRHPVTPPPDHTTPDDAACLMFTSGSTGRPKAILTPHRAITGTLHHQTYTPLGPAHTTLQCSPTGWDAFSLEFWGALLHGATTVLHPGQKPEPDTIHHLTHTHPVTTLQTSSTLFNYLVDHHPTTFEHLHTAFTGGEPASSTHVARIQERYPALRVVNGYGPAESMGFTTTYEIPRGGPTGSSVPIGRPIVNKQAYVLDTALRPVPIGVTGELYLAGTGLAHGYHNQPTLTATRFVPHPYGPPGTRLYRTGDLAHWTTHGHLHYDGRTDTQIKIRGFRIEPAEIEHTLLHHPHITQAALTPTTNPTGQPCLTAYLTTTHDGSTDVRSIRQWLRDRLPQHMIPAAFMVLDRLPFTPNGKLDHRALPAPRFTAAEQGREPRTDRERLLCDLFREVLNTARPVTIDDDFFDLGGHSLLAARLTHRTNHTLDTHLTIRDVFQAPTVAHLTTRIDAMRADGDGGAPVRRARPALRRRTSAGALLPQG